MLLKKYSLAWGNVTVDADVGGWGERSEAEQENRLSPRARGVWLYVDGRKEGEAWRGCLCVKRGGGSVSHGGFWGCCGK